MNRGLFAFIGALVFTFAFVALQAAGCVPFDPGFPQYC